MSTTTSDLQLFKYDTSTDGKEVFSISSALNANWDKIDSFASAIKSLSNLSTEGEKRFTDLENSIANKLEADVLLAENGYIKFNNIILQWGQITLIAGQNGIITLPITYEQIPTGWCCKIIGNYATSVSLQNVELSQVTVSNRTYPNAPEGTPCRAFTIGI